MFTLTGGVAKTRRRFFILCQKKLDNQSSETTFTSSSTPGRTRARIARAVEEACNLPGNECGPDFEEFLLKYTKKSGSGSDFA